MASNLEVGNVKASGGAETNVTVKSSAANCFYELGETSGTKSWRIKASGGDLYFQHDDSNADFTSGTNLVTIDSAGRVYANQQIGAEDATYSCMLYPNYTGGVAGFNLNAASNGFGIWDNTVERFKIDNAGLATFSNGVVTSEKGIISGSVEIEDNGVTTITPARKGGFLMLSVDRTSGAGALPQPNRSAQIFFDCGTSLAITDTTTTGIGSDVELTISDVTGSSGSEDKITIAVQTDVIKIENRIGETNYFHYTIIC